MVNTTGTENRIMALEARLDEEINSSNSAVCNLKLSIQKLDQRVRFLEDQEPQLMGFGPPVPAPYPPTSFAREVEFGQSLNEKEEIILRLKADLVVKDKKIVSLENTLNSLQREFRNIHTNIQLLQTNGYL